MRRFTPVNKITLGLSWLVAIILALLPFHAFLTVWLSNLTGHYTLLRLWKEFLLLPLVIGAFYILGKDKVFRKKFFSLWLVKLIIIYALLLFLSAFVAKFNHDVSTKAMWYGLLVDLRFLAFFCAVLVIAASSDWLALRWKKILIGPAALVAGFAILQFLVLPYDFLKHFGYGPSTISPYETINHNLHHIRVGATLRGANPLGAYLILPITVLAAAFVRDKRQKLNIVVLAAGLVLALAFSFSRSAWIGAAIAVVLAVWLSLRSGHLKSVITWSAGGLALVLIGLGIILRNNLTFENYLLHTDKASKITASSNQGHSAAFKAAARDIAHHPLGSGVGTAGPQSFYNFRTARVAENYYLQIGQEAGILGMALFIAILGVLGKMLFDVRSDTLALAVFASLIGLSVVNLLSHAWADDTLAYVWWGLAAIALTPVIIKDKHNRQNGQKIKTSPQSRNPVR